MKKIVAAAAAGLMLASAAFADVHFNWTGSSVMGGTSKALAGASRNDCISLELSNDIAGVVADWDIDASSAISMDSYYAWLTYSLPVGNLQITTGKWSSRYVSRVNQDAGDMDAQKNYFELEKPGCIIGIVGKDSDNLTKSPVTDDKEMATVLAYTLADKLPGTLMVKAGLSAVDWGSSQTKAFGYWDSTKTAGKDTIQRAGYVAEVCYAQEGLLKFNFAYKQIVKDYASYGVFVSPLMLDKLDSMLGFTYADDDGEAEMGFDVRARYAVTEKTAVTGMFNYSTVSKEVVAGSNGDDCAAMWGMLAVSYVAGDNIRFTAPVTYENTDLSASKQTATVIAFSPACEVKASEKCNVTVGFDMRWAKKTPYAGLGDVSLPIAVSFAL